MRIVSVTCLSLAVASAFASPAQAFVSEDKEAVGVSISGTIDGTASLEPITVVVDGSGDSPGTPAALDFGTVANAFVPSGEALKVDVTSNKAGNRVIIYTANLSGGASPAFCDDTAKGNDGGGLVGENPDPGCKITVPLLWQVNDTNAGSNFGSTVGDNEVFVSDLAHVRTFVDVVAGEAQNGTLDNLVTAACDGGASFPIPPTNTPDDNVYPQYFGAPGQNQDICNASGGTVVIGGVSIDDGEKIPQAEELSKNVAVVAHSFLLNSGQDGFAPDLSTGDPTDSISVTSPFFLPLAADFSGAPAQGYGTNTLTLELITQ